MTQSSTARPRLASREAWVVFDLGFGDAGKGSVTDFLVRDREAGLVVRFNGGAQAGHNVVTDPGQHHTFSQFCSGSFVPRVRGLLGPDFILHPLGMMVEEEHLRSQGVEDGWQRTLIDERARVITPYQQAIGRIREFLRADRAHGTCGVGVGECVRDSLHAPSDTIRAGELGERGLVFRKLKEQRARKSEELRALLGNAGTPQAPEGGQLLQECQIFDDDELPNRVLAAWTEFENLAQVVPAGETAARIADEARVVFEGAQGMLLDEHWGFHPHTTWGDCSPRGALAMAGEREVRVLGLTRAYSVRHGAGPFPTGGCGSPIVEPHNGSDGWQGEFRTGPLDGVLLRYACDVAGRIDGIVVTHLDRLVETSPPAHGGIAMPREVPGPLCTAYEIEPGTRLHRLNPGLKEDIHHREELGTRLLDAKPLLEEVGNLSRAIEDLTARPVVLESFGPAAGGKCWTDS